MAMSASDVPNDFVRSVESAPRIPLVDLEAAVRAVEAIHHKAVETAPMPEVAKALGYSNATSSPFYRRVVAARLFGLLSQGSSLTQAAQDYIRPSDEGAKEKVLKSAVLNIPYYRELIIRYMNRKLNVELVKNSIVKDRDMQDASAQICAKAFEASLRFAGMIDEGGVVRTLQPPTAPKERVEEPEEAARRAEDVMPPKKDGGDDTQQHVLYLDKNKLRRFSFSGPLEITGAEFQRICRWLEFTMLIVDPTKETQI
jgi:hypothetical protein